MDSKTKQFIIIAVVIILLGGVWMWWTIQSKPEYQNPDIARPFLGQAESEIVVTEFSDFQCPACAAAQATVKKMVKQYGDRIRFEYHHLPIKTLHPKSYIASQASECALDQGKFWEYHDLLYANQPNFSDKDLTSYASTLELDLASFDACLKSGAKEDIVKADVDQAYNLDITSTPSFFVNGQPVANWTVDLERMIKQTLGE